MTVIMIPVVIINEVIDPVPDPDAMLINSESENVCCLEMERRHTPAVLMSWTPQSVQH